jgi:hypothetical protein
MTATQQFVTTAEIWLGILAALGTSGTIQERHNNCLTLLTEIGIHHRGGIGF